MKKIFFLLSLNLFILCKAQTPIINLYGNEDFGKIENGYYKDVDDFHNQFVGTWLYQNGNTSLKLIFEKRNQKLRLSPNFYEDILVGEYQYIENGVDKINTLPNINIDYGNLSKDVYDNHNIVSISQIRYPETFPQCNECLPNEKRLEMTLSEPNYNGNNERRNIFVVRSFIEGGVNKLKVWFINLTQTATVDSNGNTFTPPPYILPTGEYILTKQ